MNFIKINGGRKLSGNVYINGSKNASLGVIVASLLSRSKVIIKNVPRIKDIYNLLEIIKGLNVEFEFVNDILILNSKNIEYKDLTNELVKKFRASYYFMGLFLGIFNKCIISHPGGCNFEDRPIDIHLDFFKKMGMKTTYNDSTFSFSKYDKEYEEYVFKKVSVGASINALIYVSSLNKKIKLKNVSIEPEVMQVVEALRLMGVEIIQEGNDFTIDGKNEKHGFMIRIIPDRMVAGTYALIAASIGKEVNIYNINKEHLIYLLSLFSNIGVNYQLGVNSISIYESNEIKGVSLETDIYPSFPSDLQQPLTALLCIACSKSRIKDNIYLNRLSHINELKKMNARIEIKDNTILIGGSSNLIGNKVECKDLRCGASLILAALVAKGTTYIKGIDYISRGYQDIVENLKELGADIEIYEED